MQASSQVWARRLTRSFDSFDRLPDPEKHELAYQIMRRTTQFEFPPLTDDELVANAEAVFLDLDRAELADEESK